MMGPSIRHRSALLATKVSVVVALLATACAATPDPKRQTDIVQPSRVDFVNSVSGFLEVKCGSLDCHGTVGRPMRIYSVRGLRMPTDAGAPYPGGAGDVNAERNANYDAVIGVQPEEISRVVANDPTANVDKTYLVGKAIGVIQHKGGKIFEADSLGHTCLVTWLSGQADGLVDKNACTKAAVY